MAELRECPKCGGTKLHGMLTCDGRFTACDSCHYRELTRTWNTRTPDSLLDEMTSRLEWALDMLKLYGCEAAIDAIDRTLTKYRDRSK